MISYGNCPCGSGAAAGECCEGIVSGHRKARTAEQLMRSRYTAYVLKDVEYLVRTTLPASRSRDLADSIRHWMDQVEWLRLHVISFSRGGIGDSTGTVEFVAEYVTAKGPGRMHEDSQFRQVDDEWYYVGEVNR